MERKHIEKSIDVKVPLRTAYNQWTQFESFPAFMEGVESVKQLDEKRLHWKAKIAGKTVEWGAEIVEQEPDSRITWRSTSGAPNSGSVSFRRLADDLTRINLRIEYTPSGPMETIGDALGVLSRRVSGDLERFKDFIEKRGSETGAWRGEIHGGETTTSPELRV
jgi:uncharacterized membrane protein